MSAFVWMETPRAGRAIVRACAFAARRAGAGRGRPPAPRRRPTASSRSPSPRARPGARSCSFTLKAPPADPPAGFAIANPARVALDFLDTGNGLGRTAQEVAEPTLRSVNVVQAGNRTRVVLNLNKPQTFETQVEGNVVLVTLFDQSDSLDAKAQTVQRFAEAKPGDVQHALRDVDFRRGNNGEGRIIVDLSDNATGIDIRQQGKPLIVDFIGTSVPRNLERRLDVAGLRARRWCRSTRSRRAATRGWSSSRRGLWEHSAYQADNRFILEVKPIQEDPNKLMQGSRQGYKGEKLSLNFQNVEVRAVLQVIADFTGLNIITSDTVERQPDAAPEGRAVGPGARHHHADQGPRHAQERQHRSDRAARGAGAAGEAAARERDPDQRARAADPGVVPAELHEGGGLREDPVDQPPAAIRPRRRPDGAPPAARARSCPSAASRSSIRAPTSCSCRTPRRASRRSAGSSASSTRRSGRC